MDGTNWAWFVVVLLSLVLLGLAGWTVYTALTAPAIPTGLPIPVRAALIERLNAGEIGYPVQLTRVWLAADGRVWYQFRVSAVAGGVSVRVWVFAVYDWASGEVNWFDRLGGGTQ